MAAICEHLCKRLSFSSLAGLKPIIFHYYSSVEYYKTVACLPMSGILASSPKGQTMQCSEEIQKNSRSQTLQVSVSMLNAN